jgi:hypothetical protein
MSRSPPIDLPIPLGRSGLILLSTSSCLSKLPPARAPPSLSPTTHLRPHPLCEVPACHGTLMVARSSSSQRTSRSRWPCRSTRRLRSQPAAGWLRSQARQRWCSSAARSMWQSRRRGPTAPTARGSRGALTALVTEEAPLLQLCGGRGAPTTRRSPEEARAVARGDPPTMFDRVYLDGHW